MADTILNSAVQSPLLSTLTTSLKTSYLGPSISRNFPNVSKKLIKLNPVSQPSSAGFGDELLWNIPSNFHIDSMMIESNPTIVGDNSANDYTELGERFFSVVSLKSHGSTIFQQTDGSCKAAGLNQTAEKALTHTYLTNVNQSANVQAVKFYTPIYNAVFDKVESSLDASFLEKMTLSATINSQARTGLSVSTGMGACNCYLWISGWSLTTEDQEKLEASIYKSSEPVGVLTSNVYQEIHAITSGDTSITIDCKCKNVVSEMAFFIRVAATGVMKPITDYTFSCAGQTLYSSVPDKVANWQRSRLGLGTGLRMAGLPAGVTGTTSNVWSMGELKPITIEFGLEGDGTYNSGSVAFSGLSNPQLALTFADPGANAELVVVYRSHQLVMISPASGSISIGSSV